jgi:hypothetical protein
MTCSFAEWSAHSFVARQFERLAEQQQHQHANATASTSSTLSTTALSIAPTSSLTRAEHAEYVRLAAKLRRLGGPAGLTESERVALFERQGAVDVEQTMFLQRARAALTPVSLDDRVTVLVQAMYKAMCSAALSTIEADASVPLVPTEHVASWSDCGGATGGNASSVPDYLQLHTALAVIGARELPRVVLPNNAQTALIDARVVVERVLSRQVPPHADEVAVKLAAEHDCDVVVDAQALVDVFAHAPPVDRFTDDSFNSTPLQAVLAARAASASEWRTLVVMRDRRAFIGAPLPPASLSRRDANAAFFAEALRPDSTASSESHLRYELWLLGQRRVLVRSAIAASQAGDGRPFSMHVDVARTSDEPPTCELRSECAERLLTQWLLRGATPSADALPATTVVRVVAGVGTVASSTNTYELQQLQQQQFALLPPDDMAYRWRAVGALLECVRALATGTYLLRRRASEPRATVWRCDRGKVEKPAFPTIGGVTPTLSAAVAVDTAAATRVYPSLSELLVEVGVLDNERNEFVPAQWTEKNRAPFTFADGSPPVAPIAAPTEAKAKRPVFENVRYCHSFALHGVCREGAECKFPHLTQEDAAAKAAEANRTLVAGVRYCHAFAVHGSCKDGAECKFPHMTHAEARTAATAAKKRKKQNATTTGSSASTQTAATRKRAKATAPPKAMVKLHDGAYDDVDSQRPHSRYDDIVSFEEQLELLRQSATKVVDAAEETGVTQTNVIELDP